MPGVKWTLKEAGGILDVLNSSVFNFKNWPMSSSSFTLSTESNLFTLTRVVSDR